MDTPTEDEWGDLVLYRIVSGLVRNELDVQGMSSTIYGRKRVSLDLVSIARRANVDPADAVRMAVVCEAAEDARDGRRPKW